MLSVLYSSFFSTKDKISSKKTKSTKKLFWLCFNSLMHVRRIQLRSRPASIEAAVFYLYTQASWYDCYTLYKLYSVIQQCNILCTFCTLYIVYAAYGYNCVILTSGLDAQPNEKFEHYWNLFSCTLLNYACFIHC